jgi:chromosome segregation ATPase
MSSFLVLELEWKSALKALQTHVRALTDLAQLHRIQRVVVNNQPQQQQPHHHQQQHQPQQQLEIKESARDDAATMLRVQLHVVSEQEAQQEARVRELSELLQECEQKLRIVSGERDELQTRLTCAEEVLADVRDAFLTCTQRLGDIDAERDRFARVAATVRAQNERLREHVALLEAHATWLANKIAQVVIEHTS